MDYKGQIETLKNLEAIAWGYHINGEVLGMDCSDFEQTMEDVAESITDLLARAEAAEKELEWKNMVIEAAERRFTEAEAKCKRLDESRERANESAHMWESRCKMLEERAEMLENANRILSARITKEEDRAEKAERERDAAVSDLTFAVNQYRLFTTDIDLCGLCKFDLPPVGESGQTAECPGFYKENCFEWRGIKEE